VKGGQRVSVENSQLPIEPRDSEDVREVGPGRKRKVLHLTTMRITSTLHGLHPEGSCVPFNKPRVSVRARPSIGEDATQNQSRELSGRKTVGGEKRGEIDDYPQRSGRVKTSFRALKEKKRTLAR